MNVRHLQIQVMSDLPFAMSPHGIEALEGPGYTRWAHITPAQTATCCAIEPRKVFDAGSGEETTVCLLCVNDWAIHHHILATYADHAGGLPRVLNAHQTRLILTALG